VGNGTTTGSAAARGRVLHVERSTFVAALARATLEDAGFDVETVSTLDVVPAESLGDFDVCLRRVAAAGDLLLLPRVSLPTVVVPMGSPSSPQRLVQAVATAVEARRRAA
jgi:hypothetical protein